jgi:ABC-type multidrug transport system ATPase subunit
MLVKKNQPSERRVDKTPGDHLKIEEHPITVDVQNVSKFYGSGSRRKDILKNVSLQVKMGRVCCLLGPNGSGKTTLLKILAGLLDPNSGSVTVNGIDRLKNLREAKAQIGWMPAEERSGLYGRITGRDNLMFFGALQGMDRAAMNRAIGNLALQIGIDDELDQTVLKVSSGAKQKIGLARAMLHGPAVLILDEPIRNLDPQTTLRFRRLIKDHITRIQHKTVILSTHLLEEARRIADMIVIVRKGEIVRVIEGLDLENELQTSTLEDIYMKSMAEEKPTL